MAEQIELQSLNVRNKPDGDVEEYHEIEHNGKQLETLEVENFVSKFALGSINDYDFFTQMDGKSELKESTRKKKRKHKRKPSNIMDIISSELASLTIPITETLIEVIEDRQNYQSAYVQSFSRNRRRYQRRKTIVDSEYG